MEYTAAQITVLEGLEPVRKRPGMYIGDTGTQGLHHCLWEIVDNAIDEHLAGFCQHIDVRLTTEGAVEVIDDGRGIPVEVHPEKGIPAVTLVLTTLHAGGKFDNESQNSGYKVSGGLHGVGASVVNALSEQFEVTVWRNGREYVQRFSHGHPIADLMATGPAPEDRPHGTRIRFLPDSNIFKNEEDPDKPITFDPNIIAESLSQRAYLNPGLTITFIDEHSQTKQSWNFKDFGEILSLFAPKTSPLIDPIVCQGKEETPEEDIEIQIAMNVWDTQGGEIRSFANTIRTPDGGTHEQGLKTAYLRVINKYALENGLVKEPFDNADVREGWYAAIAVKLASPNFAGQTKGKLTNASVLGAVTKFVFSELLRFFEEHPKAARAIISRAQNAMKARMAAERARATVERKNPLSVGTLPGKLADCQSNDPQACELFVVEGDSAGGSAKQGRNRQFQAILPLKGKPLNTWKSDTLKITKNEEIMNIIQALCLSLSKNGKVIYDPESLRYHKIILLADADVDGAHITTLLITALHSLCPELIERGHLFIAQPPLYRAKKGTKHQWIANDDDLKAFLAGNPDTHWEIQRFKGLGEMNPEELWETTMNPETRTLLQIKYDEQMDSIDDVFDLLMGKDVPPRRAFIEEHAEFANIDV